jgi:hypothetical protein
MEKPKKPIEPNIKNYPIPKEPNGKNYLGVPIYQRLDYIRDCKKFQKDLDKYDSEMEVYEQSKLIRLIKNATEKYCLKTFKITKR